MEPTRTGPPAARPSNPMARIEARLERLERMLAPIAQVAEAAPTAIAVLSDTIDQWDRGGGEADERLRRLVGVVERLTRPEMLDRLELLVEQLEQAPGFVAMFGDIIDDLARKAEAQGVSLDELVANARLALLGAAKTAPVIAHVFDSGMLNEGAVQTLGTMARAIEVARTEGVKPVGFLGALGAMRDPQVQRALGFLLSVGRTVGAELSGSQAKGLPAGAELSGSQAKGLPAGE